MQNLQHPYGEIFAEIKFLLTELSQTDSYKDLLDKENELNHLYQKFSKESESDNSARRILISSKISSYGCCRFCIINLINFYLNLMFINLRTILFCKRISLSFS